MKDCLRPGIIVSQVWPESRSSSAEAVRAVEKAAAPGFFEVFQLPPVDDRHARRDLAAMAASDGLSLTVSLSDLQYREDHNLAALDKPLRLAAVDAALAALDGAAETGAAKALFVGGAGPEAEAARPRALDALARSVASLAARGLALGIGVMIEPLDVHAHKKGALGYTHEAVDLVRRVGTDRLSLCFDTAHARLNGEDVGDSLAQAAAFMGAFHFCNCVTAPDAALFGDWHIPFGPPGWLDEDAMADLFARGRRAGLWNSASRLGTFCEMHRPEGMDSGALAELCRAAPERAWLRSMERAEDSA